MLALLYFEYSQRCLFIRDVQLYKIKVTARKPRERATGMIEPEH